MESVKAAFDIYAPVSGKITGGNNALESNPGLINQSPYAEGWIFELEVSDPAELGNLLTPAQYREAVLQAHHRRDGAQVQHHAAACFNHGRQGGLRAVM